MADKIPPAHHTRRLHQPQLQPAQRIQHPPQPVQLHAGPHRPSQPQHPQLAANPPQPTLPEIITALPHIIDNLYGDFYARFQRIEAFLAETRGVSPSQSPPANSIVPTPDFTYAAFAANFSSLETKLTKIQRDVADTREERCADMLSVRQGMEAVTRVLTSLGGRLGRTESSLTELSRSVEDNRGLKDQMQIIERSLSKLLERPSELGAETASPKFRQDVAVMTEERTGYEDLPLPARLPSSSSDVIAPLTPLLTTLPILPPLSLSPIVGLSSALSDPASKDTTHRDLVVGAESQSSTTLVVRTNASTSVKTYIEASTSTDTSPITQPKPADFINTAKSLVSILSSLTATGQLPAPFVFGANPFAHLALPQLQGQGHGYFTDHFSLMPKREGSGKGKEREVPDEECDCLPKHLSPAKWSTQPVVQTQSSSESTPAFTARDSLTYSPVTCTDSLPPALGKRKRPASNVISEAAPAREHSTGGSERKTRRLSVSTSFSSLSSSRQSSPGPTIAELRRQWMPSSQAASQVLEKSYSQIVPSATHLAEAQSINEQPVEAQAHTAASPEAAVDDFFGAQPPTIAEAPREPDQSSTTGLPTGVAAAGPSQPLFSEQERALDAHVYVQSTSAPLVVQDSDFLVNQDRALDLLTVEEIKRELGRIDALILRELGLDGDNEGISDPFGDDVGAGTTFAEVGMEREVKVNVMALTEENVKELEARSNPRSRAASKTPVPLAILSGSSLSSLTPLGSGGSSDSDSDSQSVHTVQKHLLAYEEPSEPEEEEETARAEIRLSLLASGKRKRYSTAKARATIEEKTKEEKAKEEKAKKQKVVAALFPSTPFVSGQGAASVDSASQTFVASSSNSVKGKGRDMGKSSSMCTSASAPPPRRKHKMSKHSTSAVSTSTFRATGMSNITPGMTIKKKYRKGHRSQHKKASKATTATEPMGSSSQALRRTPWEVVGGYNEPCEWPGILTEGSWVGDFIECSGCEAWYHFGCLSVAEDDPRTAEGVDLYCPPCEASIERHGVPRKLRNIVDQHCARPDCVLHARTASNDFKTYFVERIIGRISRVPSGHEGDEDSQMDFMWLFKWMDYPASQCTWEDSSKLPTNSDQLISEFENAARAEGFLIDNPERYIVLHEGAKAGWRRPGWS